MLPYKQQFVPWNSGIPLKSQGFVIHETADKGAPAVNEYNWICECLREGNTAEGHVFAHVYIDSTVIWQFAPLNVECFHAMDPANNMFAGFECCHVDPDVPGAAERFNIIYENAAQWGAYYLRMICGITQVTKNCIMSHEEVSLKWRATTHVDPTEYFAMYGKSIDTFRARVQDYINEQLLYNRTKMPFVLIV